MPANISSTDAIRTLKAALLAFAAEVNDALTMLEMEARRPVEWIEVDRTQYWPREVRKASDATASARINLAQCELTIHADDRRACYEEKKALEKCKQRMRLAEEKVRAVRRWRVLVKKEVEEFLVHVSKLRWYLDSDFLRAVAALEQMSAALDRYTESGPLPSPAPPAELPP